MRACPTAGILAVILETDGWFVRRILLLRFSVLYLKYAEKNSKSRGLCATNVLGEVTFLFKTVQVNCALTNPYVYQFIQLEDHKINDVMLDVTNQSENRPHS